MAAPNDEPALTVCTPAAGPTRAVAVVLHGGREHSHAPVRAHQLAVLRMRPFAGTLRRAGGRCGLAVARLRYLVRGWNADERSPVHDLAWALGRLAERFPDAPIGLVGHSMGGRAAVYAAGHPSVRSVVALAPWLEPDDEYGQLAGRRLLVVHGDRDRRTDARHSAAFAREAAAVAASAGYVSVRGDRHAMMGRAGLWHALAAGFLLATLCGEPPHATVEPVAAKIVARVLAGETPVVV